MKATLNEDERFEDLIAGYALGDLNDHEIAELYSYPREKVEFAIERTEAAAARALLAFEGQSPHLARMPDDLRKRLTSQAWSSHTASDELRLFSRSTIEETFLSSSALPAPESTLGTQPKTSMELREMVGWFAAIAATALAIASWLPSWNDGSAGGRVRSDSTQQAAVDRAALLASADDLVRVSWTRPADATPTNGNADLGDVVWSSKFQRGYMRIQGLKPNDPTQEQYQLWILDPNRDSKPVDGGVFDIDQEGEVVLPIHAKLKVDEPTLFAITIEKPGGVVVSDQSRLPLLAVVSAR
ncbi:anti-sigma factor [Pirellulaceae bacterium SH467]